MRIVRFIDLEGLERLGEDARDGTAVILEGSLLGGLRRTNQRARIVRLLAPIVPADIICIGRNYEPASPHAGSDRREDPDLLDATLEVFLKPSTALQNPNDPIVIPHFPGIDVQLDCEGELAAIIGGEARNLSESDALGVILGYTLANDVTARHFQTPTGPPIWMRGKGFDTFCPLGPAIVTADELADPANLDLRTSINGAIVRDGNTRDMIRSVPQIVAALSRHMTLRAGSVVLTGAPLAMASMSLNPGAKVSVISSRIGELSNPVSAAQGP